MIAVLVGLAALFVALLVLVQSGGWLVALDGRVNASLRAVRLRPVLGAASWISQVGTGAAGAFIGLVGSGLLWAGGGQRFVLPFWVTFAGAQTTTWSLKFITKRVRPDFLEGITAGSPSFPSAHSTVSVAVYLFFALVIAQGAPGGGGAVVAAGLLIALAICASRMVLSLHYFSDVLAGATVGLFWALLGWRLAGGA